MIKKYIKRQQYLDRIKPFIDQNLIKVLVGQRRAGKSYLLFQIMDVIKAKYKTANIIYINKELNEFEQIRNSQDLLRWVAKQAKPGKKNYLFIDEVQEIDKFEKALRSLNTEGRYDIYCTGSNANLLSGELATYLGGRYLEIPVYSLSYLEFLSFHKLPDVKESLAKYIRYGGLPYLHNLELNPDAIDDYLKNVYNTILFKDIVARHKVRQIYFLENLVEYLADNIGSLVSAKRISDFLKAQKIKISPNIVLDYLSFLADAFFIFKVPRADLQGKKIFEINEKYYFEDLGLRHSIVSYKQMDSNKILENLIYMQLKIAGYKVAVGQLGAKEVDFVCEKHGEKIYIQAACLVNPENTEREFGNLLAIRDNYRKMVVTLDEGIRGGKYQGIEQLGIRDFLKEKL